MSVVAKFQGGPRADKRNTLQKFDQAPKTIPVTVAETKAKNMKPGRYHHSGDEASPSAVVALYKWVEG